MPTTINIKRFSASRFWEGSSFVLSKVTCSPYGINRIGLVVQDPDWRATSSSRTNRPTLQVYLIYSSTILITCGFKKCAHGPLVRTWTTSHLQKNETANTRFWFVAKMNSKRPAKRGIRATSQNSYSSHTFSPYS